MTLTPLDWALAYAARGWPVFPLYDVQPDGRCSCGDDCGRDAGKHPRTKNGFKAATTDERKIRSWWGRWASANIGIHADGLCILDEDPGHDGSASLAQLVAQHEPLPPTYTVRTGSGGQHHYLLPPAGVEVRNKIGFLPGLDIRATGGYVVAPPSNHLSGGLYEITADLPLAEAPSWLLALIVDPPPGIIPTNLPRVAGAGAINAYGQSALEREIGRLTMSQNGTRNKTLNTAAYSLFSLVKADALDRTAVESALRSTALTIGLKDREITKTLNSAWKASAAREIPDRKHADDDTIDDIPPPPDGFGEPGAPAVSAATPLDDTWPYREVDGHMLFISLDRYGDQKPQIISDFVARITAEYVSEDGAKTFTLAGKTTAGRSFQLEIEASAFAEERQLKAAITNAAGAQAPVRARMTPHLGAAIQRLSNEVTRMHRFTRTGWNDGRFLIPGREPEQTLISLGRKLPYRIAAEADLTKGIEALDALVQAMTPEQATIAIAFALQAPLALAAGWRNERYALFIAGRTGSLKSSWSQTLMALYGPEFMHDELLVKWGEGATRNAIMAMATHAHDMPFLIDNYKPNTGGGGRDFVNLIHNILEGGEKDRLTRTSELKDTKPVFAWPLVTGEDVPDSDPASLARVLVLNFAWQRGAINEPLATAQTLAPHLCAIGRTWLEWLESDDGKRAAAEAATKFAAVRRRWAAKLTKLRPDMVNVLRVATNLATNELTWLVLMEHPQLGAWAEQYAEAQLAGLEIVGAGMATYTAESLEASRFLSVLRELIGSGRAVLRGTDVEGTGLDVDRHVGWEDGALAYLLPTVARKLVEGMLGKDGLGGLSQQTLYSQLQGLGLIAKANPGRKLYAKRFGGEKIDVLCLPLRALQSTEVPDDETTTTE